MSARKPRSEAGPEVTAQPRPVSEELFRPSAHEPGLSVDPEDLGSHFLNEATEQHNFESSGDSDASGLSIVEGAPSDEALIGPNFESDRDVWEQTVDLAMLSGGVDRTRAEPALQGIDYERRFDEHDGDVREASLFDEEGDEPGETRYPRFHTDDDEARDLVAKPRTSRSPRHKVHPLVTGVIATAAISVVMWAVLRRQLRETTLSARD